MHTPVYRRVYRSHLCAPSLTLLASACACRLLCVQGSVGKVVNELGALRDVVAVFAFLIVACLLPLGYLTAKIVTL